MKTLYIVRHAKSSWEFDQIKDYDRPLTERGINDAYLIASVLKEKIKKPDVFISSSANRALHTAIIFSDTLGYPLTNLKINRSLYSFSDGYLLKTIYALDDDFDAAMIFTHNHGINDFVNKFGDKMIENVPTAGVVAIQFEENHWKNIKKGNTILIEFPRFHKAKKEE
ncbi:MAG: histidine phosphatase family protein [Flavobacteriaceae bacterium]|nr:histidine phosphatase family protein [Flavobacteriaceae bacterium]